MDVQEPSTRAARGCLRTVHSEPGLVRVGGAEVVGDDALVAALVPESDTAEVQDGGVLHHLPVLCPHVGKVLHVGVGQDLTVLLPGKGHGGAAAAGCRAREPDVPAHHGHRRLRLGDDLWLWNVLWGEKSHCESPGTSDPEAPAAVPQGQQTQHGGTPAWSLPRPVLHP